MGNARSLPARQWLAFQKICVGGPISPSLRNQLSFIEVLEQVFFNAAKLPLDRCHMTTRRFPSALCWIFNGSVCAAVSRSSEAFVTNAVTPSMRHKPNGKFLGFLKQTS
jgi:hypothetical protein